MALSATPPGDPAGDPPAVMPVLSARTRLCVVAPHPDDETIACGLLIQRVLAAGGEVEILLLTAGDNNPWPQRWLERRLRIDPDGRQRWAGRRQQEMRLAMQRLGLPPTALRELGWPDLGVTDHLLHDGLAAAACLAAALGRFAPTMIAMPALEDRHPDHAAAHVLMRLALRQRPQLPVWTYLVHGPAQHPGIALAGSPAQLERKLQALAAHRSQLALSGQRMRRLARRPERYSLPAIASAASTALPWRPPAWLQARLQLSVVDASGSATHWGWKEAPLQRDRDGTSHLPQAATQSGPRFVQLQLQLPTPWIFDHWGWCEL